MPAGIKLHTVLWSGLTFFHSAAQPLARNFLSGCFYWLRLRLFFCCGNLVAANRGRLKINKHTGTCSSKPMHHTHTHTHTQADRLLRGSLSGNRRSTETESGKHQSSTEFEFTHLLLHSFPLARFRCLYCRPCCISRHNPQSFSLTLIFRSLFLWPASCG